MTNPTIAVPRELASRLVATDNHVRQTARRELRNFLLAPPADHSEHLPPLIQCLRENGQQIAERAFDAQEGKYSQAGQADAAQVPECDAAQLAFELGGTEGGEYWLDAEDLDKVINRAIEPFADALRSLASYVGAGGYNAPTVDPDKFEAKVRWGIDNLLAAAPKAPEGREWPDDEIVAAWNWCEENGGTPAEFLSHSLLVKRSRVLGRPLTWREAIELTAITTNMPDERRDKLLAIDDEQALSAAQAGGGDA